jgi:hypothetical protein
MDSNPNSACRCSFSKSALMSAVLSSAATVPVESASGRPRSTASSRTYPRDARLRFPVRHPYLAARPIDHKIYFAVSLSMSGSFVMNLDRATCTFHDKGIFIYCGVINTEDFELLKNINATLVVP